MQFKFNSNIEESLIQINSHAFQSQIMVILKMVLFLMCKIIVLEDRRYPQTRKKRWWKVNKFKKPTEMLIAGCDSTVSCYQQYLDHNEYGFESMQSQKFISIHL